MTDQAAERAHSTSTEGRAGGRIVTIHCGPLPREHRPPFVVGTPEFDEEIRQIVTACEADPDYEYRTIEPLAGWLWPSVRTAMTEERARRAAPSVPAPQEER